MTTLLIIPEYQLKLGNRVGGGAFGSVYQGVWYKGPISPGFAKQVDNIFADLERPKLVPLDSLVEDNTYVSTEQEYLTMEDEDGRELKKYQGGECSAVSEEKLQPKNAAQAAYLPNLEPISASLSGICKKNVPNLEESAKEMEDSQIENVEKQVVAIKVLNDETDPSTSKALLEEARVSLQVV